MSDVLLPPWIQPQSESTSLIDDSTSVFRAALAPGAAQRVSYVEPRLQVKQSFRGLRGAERAAMMQFLNRAQGKLNTVRALVGYSRRGSFPAPELLVDNTFANYIQGTTFTNYTGGVFSFPNDHAARVRVIDPSQNYLGIYQQATVVAYSPMMARAYAAIGRCHNLPQAVILQNLDVTTGQTTTVDSVVPSGLLKACNAGSPSVLQFLLYVQTLGTLSWIAQDYFDAAWTSMARCAQVDLGTNLLLNSDTPGTGTGWFLNALTSASSGSISTPEFLGSGAYGVAETTATDYHYVQQTVTVAPGPHDYTASLFITANARQYVWIDIVETLASTGCRVFFNLNTDTVGSITNGTNVINGRATIESFGFGWQRITVTAKVTNAATGVVFRFGPSFADNGATGGQPLYAGSAAGVALYSWRCSLQKTSHPGQGILTTTTASIGTAANSNSVYARGLPVSTNGLLLPGDMVDINGELKFVTQSVDSDGAGLGHIKFHPALTRSPADGDGIVIQQPMGKFILSEDPTWDNNLGAYLDCDITLEAINE